QPAVSCLDSQRGAHDALRRISGPWGDLFDNSRGGSANGLLLGAYRRTRRTGGRERRMLVQRIGLVDIRIVFRRHPWQRVEWQAGGEPRTHQKPKTKCG